MNDHNVFKKSRTLVVLSIFIAVITLFQLSRMGLIENGEAFYQKEYIDIISQKNTNVNTQRHPFEKIAIIYDKSATDRAYIFENFKSLLNLYSIDYDLFYADKEEPLHDYSLVIAIIGDYAVSPMMIEVFDYLEKGGNVYLPIVPSDNDSFISAHSMLGIIEKKYVENCSTITDKNGIFGKEGRTFAFSQPVQMRYEVRLRTDCEVYFSDGKNPLFWERKVGSGTLFASNCDYLSSYESRGVIAYIFYQALAKKAGAFILPFYNISTLLVEEFPSPLEPESKILSDLSLSYQSFLDKRFWPLILDLVGDYGEKPTISYALSYSVNLEGDFTSSIANGILNMYQNEALKRNGEIATHGYSIRPLGLKGELEEIGWFIPWSSFDRAKQSFEYIFDMLKQHFPNYNISTYVAPQGRIGADTIVHLNEIASGVNTVVTRYDYRYNDQYLKSFVQLDNGIYCYPVTSLYNGIEWNSINSLISLGTMSTSLNANTLLERSDLTFPQFETNLRSAYNDAAVYKHLHHYTITEATGYLKQYQKSDYSYTIKDGVISIEINNWFDGMALSLFSEAKLTSETCEIEKTQKSCYVIYPKSPSIKIYLS